jgi:hypothetical protein
LTAVVCFSWAARSLPGKVRMAKRWNGVIEVWLSDDDGRLLCAIVTVDDNGQKVLYASEEFGPFDTRAHVAAWLWARLTLDPEAPLGP